MDQYNHAQIESLAAQLLRGPRRLRLRQLLGIEFLLSVVEAEKQYPLDFVCHALTGYRSPKKNGSDSCLLDGSDLISDLAALAEVLSENADIVHTEWLGPVYSVNDLADRFGVSTKTIFRWRRRGLVGWKFRCDDRRHRMMFPERCVRRFVAHHVDLVTRGSGFSQLTKAERAGIVARARELAGEELSTVNAVARAISAETGRAVETVRLILKHYDEAHPGSGIFNRSALELDRDDQRLAVWEAYVDGMSVEAIAARFDKSIAWAYATVTETRARELRARKIEFVDSEEFAAADAERTILGRPDFALRQPLENGRRREPADLPPYLAHLFRLPLLTPEGERYLFRKMNYLKWQADQQRRALDPETAHAAELDEIEELLTRAADVKNQIVQGNLRLVVGIAKRHVSGVNDLFELISDGNVSLMRAVDKFDYMRGFKFSTYASWAIMKNFARSVPEQHHRRERYQTGWDELLGNTAALATEDTESVHDATVRTAVDRMLGSLEERERHILQRRYGLDEHGEPQTLEQIGRAFGVSKERIRQLESRALAKLREEHRDAATQILWA